MTRARLDHYLASLEGLALSRHWLVGDRDEAERRFEALRRLMHGETATTFELDAPALGVQEGYQRWAPTYDAAGNPLIEVEQPTVHALIDTQPAGDALDAACGSGRHAAHLVERGHRVTAVDASAHMLALAAERAPGASLHRALLTELPLGDASIDLAICSLALTHCKTLAPPLRELARVLRPGGRLIVSDHHPMLGLLGNTALFLDAQNRAAFVESYVHLHADYLTAFGANGLAVRSLIEPRMSEAQLPALSDPLPRHARPAVAAALLGLPGAVVWQLERT